jgi:hypothetical protein
MYHKKSYSVKQDSGGPFATFIFKYRSRCKSRQYLFPSSLLAHRPIIANLQSLLIIPREPSRSPSEQVKAQGDSPSPSPEAPGAGNDKDSVRNIAPVQDHGTPNAHHAAPLRTPGAPNPTPRATPIASVPQRDGHQATNSTTLSTPTSLTKKDLLILIAHYRGTAAGLECLPKKDLSILLESYKVINIPHSRNVVADEN